MGEGPPQDCLGKIAKQAHVGFSGFLFKTLRWGGTLTVNLCMLGSGIYRKPSLESFMHEHGRFPPQCHLMGVGRKGASTHRPTERQLHVAAERNGQSMRPGGTPPGEELCSRGVGDLLPPPQSSGRLLLAQVSQLGHREGLPSSSRAQQCCLPQDHRALCVSLSLLWVCSQRSWPKKQNKTKIQQDSRQKYIAKDDNCGKHRGFGLNHH